MNLLMSIAAPNAAVDITPVVGYIKTSLFDPQGDYLPGCLNICILL